MKAPGSSIAEYSLVAALIGVACIAGLWLVAGKVDLSVNVVKKSMTSSIARSEKAREQQLQEDLARAAAAAAAASGGAGGGSKVCLGESNCFYVSSATETSGGNGATSFTRKAASNLEQIARYLQEQNADPSLIGLVTDLANSGHTFGSAQSKLWGCTSGSSCVSSLKSSQADITASVASFNKLSAQLDKYLASHPGALTDTMKSVIDYDTAQIQGIGKGYKIKGDSSLAFSYAGNAASTHKYSNSICSNGGDTKDCVQ